MKNRPHWVGIVMKNLDFHKFHNSYYNFNNSIQIRKTNTTSSCSENCTEKNWTPPPAWQPTSSGNLSMEVLAKCGPWPESEDGNDWRTRPLFWSTAALACQGYHFSYLNYNHTAIPYLIVPKQPCRNWTKIRQLLKYIFKKTVFVFFSKYLYVTWIFFLFQMVFS